MFSATVISKVICNKRDGSEYINNVLHAFDSKFISKNLFVVNTESSLSSYKTIRLDIIKSEIISRKSRIERRIPVSIFKIIVGYRFSVNGERRSFLFTVFQTRKTASFGRAQSVTAESTNGAIIDVRIYYSAIRVIFISIREVYFVTSQTLMTRTFAAPIRTTIVPYYFTSLNVFETTG